MTDREALAALTAPEPDIWESATVDARRCDCTAWDEWNAARTAAIKPREGISMTGSLLPLSALRRTESDLVSRSRAGTLARRRSSAGGILYG